jgi:iron complex transport system ATP-binding protein
VISARDVSVHRGAATLLHSVSLEVGAGEVLAVVGPNGAGKSTLLRVLCGDERPTGGSVSIGGRAVETWRPDELARYRAILPQQSVLDFDFTAEEVVALGRSPWRGGASMAIVSAALALVGMAEKSHRRYPTLSGGEQQRVHLARVLAQLWPETTTAPAHGALLLDEPVASLDPQHQHRTLQLARAMAARGLAVIVVLHDLNLAVQYADRIALLCLGRVEAVGPAHSVLDAGQLSAVYGTGFDIIAHPCADCPLVLPRPAGRVVSTRRRSATAE